MMLKRSFNDSNSQKCTSTIIFPRSILSSTRRPKYLNIQMNSAQAAVSTQFQDSVELEEGIRLSQSPDFIIPYEGASYADLIEVCLLTPELLAQFTFTVFQTLLVNQFMYDEVVKEVKHYKNENSRLRGLLEFNGKNTRSRKSDAAVPEVLLPHVDAINILGKKFAVMVYPWLKASAFVNLTGRPAIISHGSLRYRNAENIELALTADLYDNVPSVFHHLMQCEPKFGDMVRIISSFASDCRII